jgi:hypothetical protein
MLRRWAAKELGVSPTATADEARAAFLRRLPREDFVPPPALVRAARCLGVGPAAAPRDARARAEASRAEEDAVRTEIEDFADRYWKLSPAERRACWDALSERAAFSLALRARLQGLEAGLDVAGPELPPDADPHLVELARQVCAIYVLPLGPRVRAWQSLRREMRPRLRDWKFTARRLLDRYPSVAALQGDAVEKLAAPEVLTHLPPPPLKTPAAATPGYQQSKWLIWVAVTVGISIVRLVLSISDHSSRSTMPAPPAIYEPVYKDGRFYTPDGKLIPSERMGEALKQILGDQATDKPARKSP